MSRFLDVWCAKSGSIPVVLLSAAAGVALALWNPGYAKALSFLVDVYISLLMMIAVPFMVSALIFNLSELMHSKDSSKVFGLAVRLIVLAKVGVVLLAIAIAVVVGPGRDLSGTTLDTLGQLVGEDLNGGDRIEMALLGPLQPTDSMSVKDVMLSIVPNNIFAALSRGETLKVLIFSLLFGLVVGRLPQVYAQPLNDALRGVYQGCLKLTIWFNYLLPVVLTAMVANLVATSGVGPLRGMLGFLVALGGGCLFIVGMSLTLIRWVSGASWSRVLSSQRESYVMAVATRSSPACMPLMIEGLARQLRLPAPRVELMVPLGVSLLRLAPVLYYATAVLFVAQMFGRELAIAEYVIIALGAVLASFAATGLAGVAGMALIGVICSYVGLPFGALLVLFVTIEPVTETFGTLSNVAAVNAFAALACRGETAVEAAAGTSGAGA